MPFLERFEYFNYLPKELRLLIWEFYFSSPRLHVVHPKSESRAGPDPPRDVLFFDCTVLDAGTNIAIQDGPLPSWINHEAHAVAAVSKPRRRPVDLARGLVERYPGQRWAPHPEAWGIAAQPVYVSWDSDMLYVCVRNAEQAFQSLRHTSWCDRVRRLGLLVPLVRHGNDIHQPIPYGTPNSICTVLQAMKSLEKLSIVLLPTPEAAEAVCSRRRDAFGFVPYVDYLRDAGLDSSHMSYVRCALSFKKALSCIQKEIKLERVVDVDFRYCDVGHYQRRERLF
ncbi:hypothetical protein F4779DRAFT_616472 [Xylariaceae sp. FL0662B]|nr:hypothetical protein F4779DRAFT_616472 [Xylariaceae sp. FL0662B]